MANEMALRFRVEASMAEAKAALDQGSAAFRKFGADAKAALSGAATGYQGMVNDFAGVKPAFMSATDSADAFKDALNLQDQMNNLRASLDPAYAATLRFSQAQDLAANAVRAGSVSQAQADSTLTALSQKLGIAEGASQSFAAAQTSAMAGANRNAGVTANVAAQFNDIGVMLAAGQNPFMLAIQQGTQLSQVLNQTGGGIRGAAAALRAGFMAMISPTTLLTIAVIAGGAALVQWAFSAGGAVDAAKEAADATDAYGDALGTVQSQFSAATSLHSEYVQAVLSGNADLIKAIELEAKARQAQFNLDQIGQEAALKEALKTQDAQRAALDATWAKAQDIGQRILALEAEKAKYAAAPDGAMPADIEPQLEAERVLQASIVDLLRTQRAELDATEKKNDVIIAQSAVLEAKIGAVGDLIAVVTGGVIGTSDALGNATGAGDALRAILKDAWDAVIGLNNAAPNAGWLDGAIGDARTLGNLLWDAVVAADAAKTTNPTVTRLPGGVDAIARGEINVSGRNENGGQIVTRRLPPVVETGSNGGGGSGGGATSDGVTGLSSKAQTALSDLDLAIATINEKVKAGLMSTAEAGDAVSAARAKAGNDIAALIAQVDRLGPAGQAAATALRASLIDVTKDLQQPIDDLSKSLSEGLTQPLKDFMKGAKTAGDVFEAFGDSVIDKLMDIALQQAQTQLFQPLISGLMGGLGGGGGIGAALAGAFGGAAAPQMDPMAGVNAAMSAASSRMAPDSRETARRSYNQPSAPAPQVSIKIEGVPAGHTATVDQKSNGMDQMLTVMIERVESAIAGNVRSGRGSVGSAISDTYGIGRRPR